MGALLDLINSMETRELRVYCDGYARDHRDRRRRTNRTHPAREIGTLHGSRSPKEGAAWWWAWSDDDFDRWEDENTVDVVAQRAVVVWANAIVGDADAAAAELAELDDETRRGITAMCTTYAEQFSRSRVICPDCRIDIPFAALMGLVGIGGQLAAIAVNPDVLTGLFPFDKFLRSDRIEFMRRLTRYADTLCTDGSLRFYELACIIGMSHRR